MVATAQLERTRILIADDHPVVRLGLASLLENQAEFLVVGQAACCSEVCEKATQHDVDLVVLDLEMGDACGVEAVLRLKQAKPDCRIVVFSAHSDNEHVIKALEAGVDGYAVKGMAMEMLCDGIREVMNGGLFLCPTVASKVGAYVRDSGRGVPVSTRLTGRELTVLHGIAAGKRNREIADELYISERTVKFHASSLLSKLGAKNRTEAVKIAATQKLIYL